MKSIIKRNLSLETKYTLIDKKYISLEDGFGCTCANCGKLIANIATVKNESSEVFNIGFDCLETFLINNSLLDGKSILEYQQFKKFLPTYLKRSKDIKEFILNNKSLNVVSIEFDTLDFKNHVENWSKYHKQQYLTYYYIFENGKKYNSNLKLANEVNINDFLDVVKSVCNVNIIRND
jgi:hypothetical protein